MNIIKDNLYIYKLLEDNTMMLQTIIIIGVVIGIRIFLKWNINKKEEVMK